MNFYIYILLLSPLYVSPYLHKKTLSLPHHGPKSSIIPMQKSITVQWTPISLTHQHEADYISLTDIARHKNPEDPRFVVQSWMKSRNTVEFLWLWETIHNPGFNRIEFEAVKNEAGNNAFSLSPQKWIENTHAIGIISKSGRYGSGTYAHKDIAFKFASWISVEFELYMIKEFQRLKEAESEQKSLGWNIKRELAKVNYRIQTDSIKKYLIPTLSEFEQKYSYADEADLLNIVLFGKTAKQWREEYPDQEWNIRDHAGLHELVILINLENFNADFIKKSISRGERYELLREITEAQLEILTSNMQGLTAPKLQI